MLPEIMKSNRKVSQKILPEDNDMYRIICKNCNLALRPQIRQKKDPSDQIKIMGGIQDKKSIKQLWMIKSLPNREKRKQIVNFWTDLVIEIDKDDVKLEKGKQKPGQKFQFQFIDKDERRIDDGVEVRIRDIDNNYLTLDGILEIGKLDDEDQSQIYLLRRQNPYRYKQFQQTFRIIEAKSKKQLDVSKGDQTVGAQICIYDNNGRANQRWLFEPPLEQDTHENTKFSIVNMLSGKMLWFDKNNGAIQTDNREKIWQLRNKHGMSGELYCTEKQKYLNVVEERNLKLENYSNGTKWIITNKQFVGQF